MVMVHDPHRTGPRPSGQPRTAQAPASPEASGDRVAKLLARAGVASRRDVERLIEAGRVALNGKVLTTPAVKVEPGDILTVDGAVVTEAEPARLFRYHKPIDLVTSHKDPKGRPTVFEALPPGLPRLISVGRLDINSEGLLLLTNDGGLARALEMPTTGIVRRYRARARGRVTQERLDTLKNGITVEGVHYGAIEATLDKAKEGPQGANLWITVVLAEGKNREVRRVLEALGLKVNRLIRLSYGPFALGALLPGEVEEVGPRVIREQMAQHIAPQNLPKGDRPLWKKPAAVIAAPRRGAVEIDRPGKPARLGKPQRRARAAPSGEASPKTAYKAGWAKPKPKPVIRKAVRPKRTSGAKPGRPKRV
jgi:23S rRNA pseudouridine2605 synthase